MTTQIRKYNKSKPGSAQATITSQQVSSAVADLSGYLTREEFARYFELVNVGSEESPVTAIHAHALIQLQMLLERGDLSDGNGVVLHRKQILLSFYLGFPLPAFDV